MGRSEEEVARMTAAAVREAAGHGAGKRAYRLTGTVHGETLDEGRWRLTARMPAFDEPGWEGYYATDAAHEEQYGRIYLLAAGTGPELPVFPRDFAPRDGVR